MKRFCPPRLNPWFIHFFRWILPLIFSSLLGDLEVVIDRDSMQRLKEYRGQRMLLLPNHPMLEDPFVMFHLAKELKESFYYVAARELFRKAKGLYGFILQRVGVYSVIRGSTDRESFQMTKNILLAGKRRLVIFIEGEISHENDTLIPLEPGVLHLAFRAQADIRESASIYLAPIAIKYFYRPGSETRIRRALDNLESALFSRLQAAAIRAEAEETPFPIVYRLVEIGKKILETQEKRLSITPDKSKSYKLRYETVKNQLLQRMETYLGLYPTTESSFLERVRAVRNRMDQMVYLYEEFPPVFSAYDRKILEHQRVTFTEFYDELARLTNFMTLNENNLLKINSIEREIEMIRRLEQEVFGRPQLLCPRTAVVSAGEIISLQERFFAYQAHRRQTMQSLAGEIEANLYHLLNTTKVVFPSL